MSHLCTNKTASHGHVNCWVESACKQCTDAELATLRQRVAELEAELKRMKGAIETFTNTVRYNGTRCIAPRWVGQDLHSSILPRATAPDAEAVSHE